MYTRGRTGRFVRGVTIHEFIRDRICTWQPELLVIKTRRSPFALSFPIFFLRKREKENAKQEQEISRPLSSSVVDDVYAGEIANESSFTVVSAETRSQMRLTSCPARPFISPLREFFIRPDYCDRRIRDSSVARHVFLLIAKVRP